MREDRYGVVHERGISVQDKDTSAHATYKIEFFMLAAVIVSSRTCHERTMNALGIDLSSPAHDLGSQRAVMHDD